MKTFKEINKLIQESSSIDWSLIEETPDFCIYRCKSSSTLMRKIPNQDLLVSRELSNKILKDMGFP